MVIVACVCLFASVIFWCLGNAWILDKYKHVEYYNPASPFYCYPPLFKGTFGIVIISDILLVSFMATIVFVCVTKRTVGDFQEI
jgi:hypothetical protein